MDGIDRLIQRQEMNPAAGHRYQVALGKSIDQSKPPQSDLRYFKQLYQFNLGQNLGTLRYLGQGYVYLLQSTYLDTIPHLCGQIGEAAEHDQVINISLWLFEKFR